MKFPDTSTDSLALLVVVGLLTAVAGEGLDMVFEDPTTPGAGAVVTIAALLIGFGFVYGVVTLRAHLGNSSGSA